MLEIRKVQMTRSGTFFITLPKDWATRNSIRRGSLVASLITPDDKIIIDPKYTAEPAPRTVAIKVGPHLSRDILTKYLLGYDIITVETKDRITPEQREIIKQTLSQLVGLEITEENQSKIVIQCLLEPTTLSPEKILRREHLISSSMCKDSLIALLERDIYLAKNVIARDNEVDRLYFLLVRVLRTIIQNPSLSEKLGVHPIDCLDYRLVASFIELVADQSSQIAKYAIKFKDLRLDSEISKVLSGLHKHILETFNDSVESFISHNVSKAASVREREPEIRELINKVESLTNTLPFERAQDLVMVLSLLSRIYDHSIDISDLTT
ncbi:MAG: PhoU domain-containing protein [Candidatus Bathyarchaeia archaeon]|nr:phosphate uptake regulator PhoU [Candidatus Bathyarchaeota archaeon]